MHVSASSLPRVLDVLRYWAALLRGKTTRALIQINGGAAASAFNGFASSIASLVGVAPGLHGVMQQYKYVFLTSITGGASLAATRTTTPFCCPMTSHALNPCAVRRWLVWVGSI